MNKQNYYVNTWYECANHNEWVKIIKFGSIAHDNTYVVLAHNIPTDTDYILTGAIGTASEMKRYIEGLKAHDAI